MQYHVLAVDYDNTLATYGKVEDATLEAIRRLRQSGRRLVLVTGRCLPPLLDAFPQVALCDSVVAENGALLYNPKTEERIPLGKPPPEEFCRLVEEWGVPPLERGEVIAASFIPHESTILRAIRDLGLEMQIIFNKGAVMVLPTGINKATGLQSALTNLGYSPHNTVGIGDAENDEAFLQLCELSAAVGNALDSIKSRVHVILEEACGAGVRNLIDDLVKTDLQNVPAGGDSTIALGKGFRSDEIRIPVYRSRILVTGDSGGGKSKFALGVMDQLMKGGYQICAIDPEGDYQEVENVILLGTGTQSPAIEDILHALRDPTKSCVAMLFAIPTERKPVISASLLLALAEYRNQTGRPHWVILDEAHHLLPAVYEPLKELDFAGIGSVLYITVFPEQLPESVLQSIDVFVALGRSPEEKLKNYFALVNRPPLPIDFPGQSEGSALAWFRDGDRALWLEPIVSENPHLRHRHMYLEGDMDPADRFYFRGPKGELNIPAQNLKVFMQVAEGVDEGTWEYHLRRGDYSKWFRHKIQDLELASFSEALRRSNVLSPSDTRRELIDAIRKRYQKEV